MTHYLIEFRFHGKAKLEIKQLSHHLNSKFNLNNKKPIPHITLVAPFETKNERKLIEDFNTICSQTPFCSFGINGYGFFEDSKGGLCAYSAQHEIKGISLESCTKT